MMADKGEKERRAHDRRLVCAVAEVESDDKASLALIRNISDSGALLLATRCLDVGEPLDLVIHTSSDPDGKKITTKGSVVRREAMDPDRTDLWRWQLGVEFDEALTGFDEELAAITKAIKRK